MKESEEESICVWPCEVCESIKLPKEKHIASKTTGYDGKEYSTTYSIINPPTCPYNYVKVEGKYYKRQIDTRHNCEKDGIDFDELPPTCHDCGIKWGLVHHVGCDVERCPKCEGQMIRCDCSGGKRFFKELPRTVTPKRVRKDILKKYIQK